MHAQIQILLVWVIFQGRHAFAFGWDREENKEKASSDSDLGSASAEARRPNILLIVADDIGKHYCTYFIEKTNKMNKPWQVKAGV
jgi:hypothetical protein